MKTQMFTFGGFQTNCYVAFCEQTKEAIIIDPGVHSRYAAEKLFQYVETSNLKVKYAVNTHGHPDHTCGNGRVKEKFCVPILIHPGDSEMLGERGKRICEFFGFKGVSPPADILLHDGEEVRFGQITLKVMHCPGHSPGSIALLGEKEVFAGDTLFAGSIGRTDLPGSSEVDMRFSLKKLTSLPEDWIVYAGHWPTTTIGKEKRSNPFLSWWRSQRVFE